MIPFETAKECAGNHVVRKATLSYPYLTKPDYKFKEEGEFRAGLIVSAQQGAEFNEKALAMQDAWVDAGGLFEKSKKKCPLSIEENEDGTWTIKAKLKASVIDKQGNKIDKRVPIVDAKKVPLPDDTNIGGGTVANVSLSLWPWFTSALGFGVQFRLRAVQILDLKEFSSDAANAFDEEDGFESQPVDETAAAGDF